MTIAARQPSSTARSAACRASFSSEREIVYILAGWCPGLVQREDRLARAVAPREPGGAVAREPATTSSAPSRCACRQGSSTAGPSSMAVTTHRQGVPARDVGGGEEALAHRVGQAAERGGRQRQDERDVRRRSLGDGLPGGWRGRAELGRRRALRRGGGTTGSQRRDDRRRREAAGKVVSGGGSAENAGEASRDVARRIAVKREGRRQGGDSGTPAAEARTAVRPVGLYVVATPIGNLGDVTPRALETLAGRRRGRRGHARHALPADALRHRRALIALHGHNERTAAEGIVDLLREASPWRSSPMPARPP